MVKGLVERLKAGETLVVAEGYIFEFERRGYLKAGAFVPEVVLEHPELVRQVHEEYVHAGSDVVLAFTYYGHREKLRVIGREDELEKMNKAALKIAREVADKTGTLMAGNICNSCVYNPEDPETIAETRQIFKEQIEWAVEGGADYIVAETFGMYGEARLALDCILEYGNGLPAVITMSAHVNDKTTVDGLPLPESVKNLEDAGAAVVGINCARGPATIMPVLREIRKLCKGPIAALPVCYRTTEEDPTMQSFKDPDTGKMAFPYNLDAWFNSRTQIEKFGKDCMEVGIQYTGLCCGNCAHYTRSLAETVGKTPPSSRYSPDMSQHFIFGRGKDLKYRHEYNNIKDRIAVDGQYAD